MQFHSHNIFVITDLEKEYESANQRKNIENLLNFTCCRYFAIKKRWILLYVTQSIDKLMNGEVQITDLVISKLPRQNIESTEAYFHMLQRLLD